MMRIRIDGGRMTPDQLRAIAWASERYGRDVADITDRQNVQLHWIRIEDVPAIFERLESIGLTTAGGLRRHPARDPRLPTRRRHGRRGARRNAGDPSDPRALHRLHRVLEPAAQVQDLDQRLPRALHEPRDERHRLRRRRCIRSLGPGYDLWVGGGLSTNPMFAVRLGAFVEPASVTDVWAGVTGLFREYGYRRSRNHARLKFLVKDWGAEKVREVLETEFLDARAPRRAGARHRAALSRRDHVGVHPQRDGRCLGGVRAPGRQDRRATSCASSPISPRRTATGVRRDGATEARDPRRRAGACRRARRATGGARSRARPDAFRKGTMACTGIEFCKLAIGETKGRAVWLTEELAARLPDFDEEIRIHVNGCPNSCARFQVADIGLMSALQEPARRDEVRRVPRPPGRHDGR